MNDKLEVKAGETLPTSIGPAGKVELTEHDKEHYFKCFIGNSTYTEEYTLFDGQFKVRFKVLSQQETEDIFYQVGLDTEHGLAQTSAFYFAKLTNYRLASSIQDINGIAFQPDLTKAKVVEEKATGFTYIKKRSELFESWPSFKLAALLDVLNQFEAKIEELTKAITKKGFWKANA